MDEQFSFPNVLPSKETHGPSFILGNCTAFKTDLNSSPSHWNHHLTTPQPPRITANTSTFSAIHLISISIFHSSFLFLSYSQRTAVFWLLRFYILLTLPFINILLASENERPCFFPSLDFYYRFFHSYSIWICTSSKLGGKKSRLSSFSTLLFWYSFISGSFW